MERLEGTAESSDSIRRQVWVRDAMGLRPLSPLPLHSEIQISTLRLIPFKEEDLRGPAVGVLPSFNAFAISAAFHLAYNSFCSSYVRKELDRTHVP